VWDLEATGAELVVPALFRQQRIGLNALRRRLFVKPGLTGLWQVSGRNDLTIDQGTRLDLYYVENWSLLGDIAILLRTAREIFAPSGAY
jgi:lipopolysaccharide/colanic/teichoic acid biosynthesis glycosyltransferase